MKNVTEDYSQSLKVLNKNIHISHLNERGDKIFKNLIYIKKISFKLINSCSHILRNHNILIHIKGI